MKNETYDNKFSMLFVDETGKLCFMYDAHTKCLAESIYEIQNDKSEKRLIIKGHITQ